jgi:hypothetical protein
VTPPAPAGKAAPGVAGKAAAAGDGKAAPSGAYFYDDEELDAEEEPEIINFGPTPELHVVRSGDTLWDICSYYFNDPWQWPKVWSYNAQITNPHWIYPADLVRLVPRGMFGIDEPTEPVGDETGSAGSGTSADAGGTDNTTIPAPSRRFTVSLRQQAFVEKSELDSAIKIDGAVDAKELLSDGDEIYLVYPEGKPPRVGERYSVYSEKQPVMKGGQQLGSYVRLLGEVEIVTVKKDKRAKGTISKVNGEIERGAKVGPILRELTTVAPAAATVDASGKIVAMITKDMLIGEGEVVMLDLGKKSGVKVGNRLSVVRRGDATQVSDPIGQDDPRFPARVIGQVMVIEVGEAVSVALVTLSNREMGVGDLVVMQAPRN